MKKSLLVRKGRALPIPPAAKKDVNEEFETRTKISGVNLVMSVDTQAQNNVKLIVGLLSFTNVRLAKKANTGFKIGEMAEK